MIERDAAAVARLAAADLLDRSAVGDAFDWPAVVAEADRQLLVPALWAGAHHTGLLAPLPPSVREHLVGPGGKRPVAAILESAWERSHRRTEDLRDQLDHLLVHADRLGIEVIPIKGSHLLVEGVWPDHAARPMVDLDVVVAEADAPRLASALRAAGYEEDRRPTKAWSHHLPALRHPGRFGSVELHLEPIGVGWRDTLSSSTMRRGGRSVSHVGVAVRLPSPTDAVTIALVHGWLADEHRVRGSVPIRTLLDVVRLSRRAAALDGPVDWREVQARLARVGRADVLDRHALAAEAWLGARAAGVVPVRPSMRSRWWWSAQTGVPAAVRDRIPDRVRRMPHALDHARLERRYGPGRHVALAARRAAEVAHLRRPAARP